MATIGTPGSDILSGTNIFGLGGNDTLSSTSLFAQLVGGGGADELSITTGHPTQFPATSSNLVLIGGNGDDSIDVTSNVDNSVFNTIYSPFVANRFFDGGTGDDTITVFQGVNNFPTFYVGGKDASINTTIVDTGGDNYIDINTDVMTVDADPLMMANVVMGSGDDTVSLRNSGEGYNFAAVSNHTVNLGGGDDSLTILDNVGSSKNIVLAGNGDDTLDVTYVTDGANAGGVSLELYQDTGAGNDSVSISASGQMDGGAFMNAVLELGTGDDTLSLTPGMMGDITILAGTGDNSVTIDAQSVGLSYGFDGVITVEALGGRDSISIDGPGGSERPFDSIVSTGFGNDIVLMTGISSVDIDAGSNDDLVQVITTGTIYTYSAPLNVVSGGQGNDTLTIVDNYTSSGGYARMQIVDGGAGHDEIFSRTSGTFGLGASDVDGGSGNDDITVRGGTNNIVDGGFGKDTIDGSNGADIINGGGGNDLIIARGGDDLITGGAGGDVYVFNQFVPFGDDTITDWNFYVDVLDVNLTDNGAAGLLDDLEAITTVQDLGSTVVLSFTSNGSSITFDDTTGTVITSIGELMDDPMSQII